MTILFLDGHNLLYRSFCSIPRSVVDRHGQPVNGLYGLLSTIIRLQSTIAPHRIVVALDTPETPTFRHHLFPAYQGQRGPLGGEHAADFQHQVTAATAVLPAIGVPALRAPGFEADDIMATLAVQTAARGRTGIIMSTDRDLLQLVSRNIEVLVPASPPVPIRSAEEVRARLGVDPEGVTTWKALAGDPSDNIPGVAGIGTKTAAALVNDYGSLDAIYDQLDHLAPRVRRALEAGKERAYLFRQIVSLVTDVVLDVTPDSLPPLQVQPNDRARTILEKAGY